MLSSRLLQSRRSKLLALNPMTKELELLAPAKNKEIGIAAINCGADAVYIAAESFGAREAAGNSIGDIKELCYYAHKFHAKIFVVVNTILYDNETESAAKLIWDLYRAGADAIIVQDLGVLRLNLPPIPLYASTQTDIRDTGKAKLLEKLGFSRLIVARELSLRQIAEIASNTDVDIETFVHGALCVSYSGQCYLSARLTGRSANRGACAQACRNNYDLIDANGKRLIRNSHLLSLKDFNLSRRITDLVKAGVSSFKIEGRLKNESFVKTAVLLYNSRINDFLNSADGAGYSRGSLGSIETTAQPNAEVTFNRGFTEFFIDGKRGEWRSEESAKYLGEYIGSVVSSRINRAGFMEFTYKSSKQIVNGDGLCITDSKGNITGIRANSCNTTAKQVTTTSKEIVKAGSSIFRNYNFIYEKQLDKGNTERFIPLEVTFIQKGECSSFKIECHTQGVKRSVISFIYNVKYPFQMANNRESAERNIKLQFSKRSCHFTFSLKEFYINGATLPFFPISELNAMRNEIAEIASRKLEDLRILEKRQEEEREVARRARRDSYIKGIRNGEENQIFYSQNITDQRWQPYMLNASNRLSKGLYSELGISSSASSYELSPVKEAVLMRTKYCIKYQLGICKRDLSGRKGILSNTDFKEPLFLCNNEKKFRLVFDCSKCEMMVIG